MSDAARKVLCDMVRQYPASTWRDPQRCKGLLLDLFGGNTKYRREVYVLSLAVQDGVVDELAQQGQLPPALLVKRLIQRMRADRGLDKDLAQWAVESWADALKVYVPEDRPARKDEAEILTVSASGNGQYSTINQALQDARPGDTILIKPGIYTEAIMITQAVEIVGDGLIEDIRIICEGLPCLQVQTDVAPTIRGLTFHTRAGKVYKTRKSAVELERGTLELTDCAIISDIGAGISISGIATHPTIQRCTIHHCKEDGIAVSDQAQATIEHCTIAHNNRNGVLILQHGNPLIRNCTIHKNTGSGIIVREYGQGAIKDCQITAHTLAGIEIRQRGDPTISTCTIHQNKGSGMLIHESARGSIEDCEIFENTLAAVEIQQEGNPVFKHCKFYRGKGHGILVHKHGQGRLEHCEISDNEQAGVEIREEGDPLLSNCKIHDMRRIGVHVWNKGRGILQQCEITHNPRAAVLIKQQGYPLLQDCLLCGSRGTGIIVEQDGDGKLVGCEISGHAGPGIEIKAGGKLEIQQCQIHQNKQELLIHEGGHALKDGKVITHTN